MHADKREVGPNDDCHQKLHSSVSPDGNDVHGGFSSLEDPALRQRAVGIKFSDRGDLPSFEPGPVQSAGISVLAPNGPTLYTRRGTSAHYFLQSSEQSIGEGSGAVSAFRRGISACRSRQVRPEIILSPESKSALLGG